MLWHIAERAEWEAPAGGAADDTGETYAPAAMARDGFIHLSGDAQWLGSLRRFYSARGDGELVLLAIDDAHPAVAAALRYEAADGASFPHLYAPLPRDAVVRATDIPGLLPVSPAYVAAVRIACPVVTDVAAAVLRDGHWCVYVAYGTAPADAGRVSLRDCTRAVVQLPAGDRPAGGHHGDLQGHVFPRDAGGAVDEVALLAHLVRLAGAD